MKLSCAALVSSALFALASAQDPSQQGPIVTITSPLSGTKYMAGSRATITWISPTVQTISQIVLARGPSTALQPVSTIATNVNAQAGNYSWDVPTDCVNADDYAFELGTSPQLAFAGPFSLEGCTGGTAASSGPAAPAAGAPAAPASPAAPAAPVAGGSAPAAPASSGSNTPSSQNAHPSGTSSASGASLTQGQLMSNKAVAAVGIAVVVAAQLF